MSHNTTLRSLVLGAVCGLFVGTSCDIGSAVPGDLAKAAAGCPDISSIEAITKIDFAAEFGVDAKIGGEIKGGLEAAALLKGFADKLDADLVAACGGLATDLGKPGDYKKGPDACKAAISAMGDIRGKLGGSAKIALQIEPPRCSASLDVAAKCDGTCKGSCDAKFSGTCGGECNGKCNGKSMKGGTCSGKCEGKCSAQAEGTCGGSCSGSCAMKAAGKCSGTCSGDCSVKMKAPQCDGKIEPPKASAECNAKCEADISAKLECTPAKVGVRIEGGADAALVAQYKGALEKHLPAVLKIAIGMKDQAIGVAGNIKAVVGGVQKTVVSLKSDPKVGARLTACVAAPFKAAIDAAASVTANVDVSIEVKASASASASGSAGGSAGAGI